MTCPGASGELEVNCWRTLQPLTRVRRAGAGRLDHSGDTEHRCQPLGSAGPSAAERLDARMPNDGTDPIGHDDGVVGVTDHGDHIGDQVDRGGHIGKDQPQTQPPTSRDRSVTGEATEQAEDVRGESQRLLHGELVRPGAPQHDHEQEPEER